MQSWTYGLYFERHGVNGSTTLDWKKLPKKLRVAMDSAPDSATRGGLSS